VKTAKLSRRGAVALIVAGDLLLLLLGWFMLISPQRSTAASIVRATAVTAAQLAEARKPVRPVHTAVQQQPVIRTADIYSLAKAMPSTLDVPTLLLELDQVGRASGVTLSTISPGTVTPVSTYSTFPIMLAVTGDFYSLTDLLYRLRTLVSVRNGELDTSGRLFSVDSVSLSPAGTASGSASALSANVNVTAYIYGTNVPCAAAVAPVAPAGTATAGGTNTTSTSTTTTSAPAADVAPGP
jgi:Tfp pilus assembly protein PilO